MTAEGFAESEATAGGFGRKIQAVGAIAAGALAVVGYEATKMAIDFNASMEMLVTQAGVPVRELGVLKQGVLDLAGQVGFSPDSLAASLYHVASNMQSLGTTAPQMLSVVKVAAEGAKVGGADLVDVTNALTAAIASGIPGVKNYSQAMGALNAIVGSGDMKMQDLAEAFGSGMVATVKGFGLSLTDVGAALAVFGDNNIRGAHAGTQLRMSVMALAAPVKTGIPLLQQMGIGANQLALTMQHGGLLPALQLLIDRMRATGITAKEQGNVITQIFGKKAGAGLNVLLDQMDRLKSKYPDITKGAHDFGKAWGDTQAQLKTQLSELDDGFQALMVTLGEKLVPVVQRVVSWMLAHKQVTTILLVAVGALAAGLVVLAAATWAVNVAMAANPFVLAALAIAALVAGVIYAYTHFKTFRDVVQAVGRFFVAVWDGAVKAAGAVIKWFTDGPLVWIRQQLAVLSAFWRAHSQEILAVTRAVWSTIVAYFKVSFAIIKAVFEVGLTALKIIWNVGWAVMYGTVKMVWDLIAGVIHAAVQFVTGVIGVALDLVTGHWSRAWHDMATLTSQMFADIMSIIQTSSANFGSLLFNAGKALVTGLANGIMSALGAVRNAAATVAHTVAGFFGLSPAKWGPLAGSGAPEVRGRHFAEALASGVASGRGRVASAAGGLAGALALGGAGTGGLGAGGVLEVRYVGSGNDVIDALVKGLRLDIRTKGGGNVQAYLGRGGG